MRLSDVVSHAGLAGYAEIALVIFFVVFVAVSIAVLRPSRRRELERAARMPLDDAEPASTEEER
jgi:cbb3-type cytochrome oxidase subunit 3